MYEVNTDVYLERLRDIDREASAMRLANQVRGSRKSGLMRAARQSIGQGLVKVGQQLLNE